MNRFKDYLLNVRRYELTNYIEPRFKVESLSEEALEKSIKFNQLLSKLRLLKPETYFIHSPAGSGKTTLIWQLMSGLLSEEPQTACVRISLKSLKQHTIGQQPGEFIRSICPNTVDEALWKSCTKKNKPKIVLLIDCNK